MPLRFLRGGGLLRACRLVSSTLVAAAATLPSAAFGQDQEQWRYVVAPGDNPWSLTKRYLDGLRYWPQIQRINGITQPTRIPPGTALQIPTAWLRPRPASAEVVSVSGSPRLLREGKESPLVTGTRVQSGDRIEAPEGAAATLAFGDGSRVVVRSESVLRIDQLQRYENTDLYRTRLLLERGRTDNSVTPKRHAPNRFESNTPSAITAVRGTSYRLQAEAEATRAEVLEGRVGLATSVAPVEVPGGFGTIAKRDAAPLAPQVLLPPPDLATVPALFERVPLAFPVPRDPGVARFRLQVASPAGFDSPLFDRVSEGPLVRGPDLPDGEYRARLRGIDAAGLEGRDAAFAFVLNARPEPPILVAPPPGGPVPETSARLEWAERGGIVRYRVQVARDDAFRDLIADEETSRAPYALPQALAAGRYHWRIAAIDASEGAGPFSDPQTFRRPPSGPALEPPSVSDETLVLRWPTGLPGQRYQVQMAAQEDFAEPLVDERTDVPQLAVPRPEAGSYFVRVRALEADGLEGFFGPAQRVTVPGRPVPWWLLLLPLVPILLL